MIGLHHVLWTVICAFLLGCSESPKKISTDIPEAPKDSNVRITKDFGVTKPSEVSSSEIPITNDSEHDWQLQDVNVSCSCVKVIEKPDTIERGKTGLLKVSLTAGTKSSDVSQMVILKYRGLSGQVLVTLLSKVRPNLHIYPDTAPIVIDSIAATGVVNIRVENWSRNAWENISATSQSTDLTFTTKILSVPDSESVHALQKWDLVVKANSPPGRYGKWSGNVEIRGGEEKADLRVQVSRVHPVSCTPSGLVISSRQSDVDQNDSVRPSVLLTRGSSPIAPSDVKCSPINLPNSVKISCRQEGDGCRIVLSFDHTAGVAINGSILIQFSDGMPDISVPVLGGI